MIKFIKNIFKAKNTEPKDADLKNQIVEDSKAISDPFEGNRIVLELNLNEEQYKAS